MVYEGLADLFYSPQIIGILVILIIWEIVWKGIALWRAAKNNQPAWFVCLIIFNTVGILPILYLAFFQKKRPEKVLKKRK
ncbi:MAG: DUF5652 family protein [archaeon]|nr:DUF5652 family protein [archaeon]